MQTNIFSATKSDELRGGFEKIKLQNKNCIICDCVLDLAFPKTYITFEGDYCKKSKIILLNGKAFKHFLVYGNICLKCFKEINKRGVEGIKEFKRKFDKQLDKFRDRLK